MNRLCGLTLLVSLAVFQGTWLGNAESATSVIPSSSNQMVLVIGANVNDLHARIYLCEKKKEKGWEFRKSFLAVCGKKGWAWGLGIYPDGAETNLEPVKQEGDLKSPIGVFQFGECMGYVSQLAVNPKLTYRRLTETVQGVDDPASAYYNQVVDKASFTEGKKIDWKSFEKMKRTDDLYKWLMVIKHNPGNLPGKGSLIFLHVWKNENSGTAGCTATAETNLLEILKWLDPGRNPVLVQLPEDLYRKYQDPWGLPDIVSGKPGNK